MEAKSEEAVRAYLSRQQVRPTKIKMKPKDPLADIALFQPPVRGQDIIIFSRQFSTMIDAGLPIVQCLDILHSQQENVTFKKLLKDLKDSVEAGQTLAEALKKHPKVFDTLYVNMIAAGEAGGILDVILQRLSAYLEKAAKLKSKVKGAMMYPLITIIIAIVVVIVILVFVIPVFEEMFASMGGELPKPTKIVVAISEFVQSRIIVILIAGAIIIFGFKKFYSTDKGTKLIDDLVLKAPIFGDLIRKVAVAKFTRTMGTMLSSGVSILDALDIVAKTAGNRTVEDAIYDVRAGISEGRTMAEPLLLSGVFPSMVCSMISVGESTGALDSMMGKIADFYDEEVDQAVENLTSAIEPLMMAFLGVIIGGLVVAMYLPVFKMAGNL